MLCTTGGGGLGEDKLPWLRNSELTKAYILGAYSLGAKVCVACKFLPWAGGRQKWSLASRERQGPAVRPAYRKSYNTHTILFAERGTGGHMRLAGES